MAEDQFQQTSDMIQKGPSEKLESSKNLKIIQHHTLPTSSKPKAELHAVIRRRDVAKCRSLIENGADVNAVDGMGISPLLVACEVGKLEIVKLLIDHGANVQFRKPNGTTALHIVSDTGRLNVLELLLRNGAEVDAVTTGSTTSLFVAATQGHASIVRYLCLNGADVDKQNHRGWTPLHAACQSGNPRSIEALLEHRPNVECITSGTCSTPLHIAAMNGNLEAAELLIDVGKVALDPCQADNITPLMLASKCGNLPLVQLLLKKGADPNAVGANLKTALHGAANGGHVDVIKELIRNGAQVDSKMDNGSTALFLATNGGHKDSVEILLNSNAQVYDAEVITPSCVSVAVQRGFVEIVKSFVRRLGMETIAQNEPIPLLNTAALCGYLPVVRFLVESGIDIHLSDSEKSYNALHEASMKGKIDIVRYLLSIGMEVDVVNATGETSLLLASKFGHVDIAECLIRHGANVNHTRKSGHSALHFAAARGDIPLSRLFLENGADIEALSSDIGTPLYISAERGQVYATRFLLKKGAAVNRPCTQNGNVPLHAASAMGHTAVIEALLAAGAKLNVKNAFFQEPEEIIGLKKSLSVVERAVIESTFNRHKKAKKLQEQKAGKPPQFVSQEIRASESNAEIKKETLPPSSYPQQPVETEIGSGENPENVEDHPNDEEPIISDDDTKARLDLEEASEGHRRMRSLVDPSTGRNSEGSSRLLDIKEFISCPAHEIARIGSFENPRERKESRRRPSFGWSRLQRQPGSARSHNRCSVTESPKRSPKKTENKRLSRSGSLLFPNLSSIKASGSAHSVVSPTSLPSKETPVSIRDSANSSAGCSDSKSSSVFRKIPKCKRTPRHETASPRSATSSSKVAQCIDELMDAKGRSSLINAARSGNINVVERLLEAGMDPNIHYETHGWTPLYAASRQGHLEIVKKLLEHGANVDERINSGATALHGACASGQEQVARVLLENHARTNLTTRNGETPLHTAARNGFLHVVSLLLSKDQSLLERQTISEKSTALHLAVEKENAGAVKELLDRGANPRIAKQDGITALYLTAISGNKTIAKMLLDSPHRLDVNQQTDEKWTPLHVACARGDLEMVRFLLRTGADASLKTNMDMTPADVICEWVSADGGRTQRIREILERPPTETSYRLVEAAANGDTALVRTRIDEGADINVFGDEGLTPLLYAVRNGHVSTVHFLVLKGARVNLPSCPGTISPLHYATLGTSHQLVEFLLSNGANVGALDETGQTPMHYACHKGFTAAVSILLAYRADVHANDKHGKTPLFMAAGTNSHEVASLLLRNHAYPSCAAVDGNTPLHAAVEIGGEETVHLLLCSRCDPNARNLRRETPLIVAAKQGHVNIVRRLLTYDVELDAKDAEGNSALHIACMYGHLEVIECLLRSPCINLQLKNRKGLLCKDIVGSKMDDRLKKRDCEHIVHLLTHRLCEKQYEESLFPEIESAELDDDLWDTNAFKCPLTKQIMKNPVIASDGYTYEYTAISEWLKKKGTSPISDKIMHSPVLRHNYKLKAKIEAWRTSKGS